MSKASAKLLSLRVRSWFVALLLIFFFDAATAAAPPVTVFYFHSTARCHDCLEIERMTREVLQQAFPRQLAEGRLAWHTINADLAENAHFVLDFALSANELVVTRKNQGPQGTFDKLPEVWTLADNPKLFRAELIRMVRPALDSAK